MDHEEPEESSLVKNEHKNQNSCHKQTVLGGPEENEVRKAFRKAKTALGKVDFALPNLKRVQAVIFYTHNGKRKDQKGKGKESVYPQSRFSAFENLVEEGPSRSWESSDLYLSLTDDSSTTTTAWCNSDTLHGRCQFLWILSTVRRTLF